MQHLFRTLCAIAYLLLLQHTAVAANSRVIQSFQAASEWDEGYPIGNGRIGLLSLGAYPAESFYLNENSIWASQEVNFPPHANKHIRTIRALANEGKYKEADELWKNKMLTPEWRVGSYEFAGKLELTHVGGDTPLAITNTLNVLTGINTSVAQYKDGIILREAVALRNRDLIAIHISTTRPEGINLSLHLTHPRDKTTYSKGHIVLEGQADNKGTCYQTHIAVVPTEKQTVKVQAQSLTITGGSEALLLFDVATDYNPEAPFNPKSKWKMNKQRFVAKAWSWATLKREASEEMKNYMQRCEIDLGDTPDAVAARSTGERIDLYKQGGKDPDLEELLFQYGRYLLVASNQPDGLPNNLQGIWSKGLKAPWAADYHLNINIQMNYWPAETTGLSELHRPLLKLAQRLQPGGQAMAESLGYKGFCSGHAINAFPNTWFSGNQALWSASLLTGAWLHAHLMEHYRFTQDEIFLRDFAWPLMCKNSEFMMEWLHQDEQTKNWVTGPATSPENQFIYLDGTNEVVASVTCGNTHDLMLAWETLSDLIEAADILDINSPLVQRARTILPDLAEGQIAPDGRLQEWHKPFKEKMPGHRHVSHLYGFFPGHQYNLIEDPEMVDAIQKSLDFRLQHGGGRTGWSRAWLINIEACLQRPEKAYESIKTLFARCINPNLFDLHPPFQIDGNFGYTSGIVTMLLQSQVKLDSGERVLTLLPALPKAWPEGSVTGLHGRGTAQVDLTWTTETVTATVSSKKGGTYQVRYADQIKPLTLKPDETSKLTFARS